MQRSIPTVFPVETYPYVSFNMPVNMYYGQVRFSISTSLPLLPSLSQQPPSLFPLSAVPASASPPLKPPELLPLTSVSLAVDPTLPMPSFKMLIENGTFFNMVTTRLGINEIQKTMFPIKDNYERQALFNYMLKFRIFDSLICDPFGNIFIQKFLEEAQDIEQTWIMRHIKSRVVSLCSNVYSCRILQKLIEIFKMTIKIEILDEIRGSEIFLTMDNIGTYFIQKIFECFPPSKIDFIIYLYTFSMQNFTQIIQDMNGCRVIQHAIKTLSNKQSLSKIFMDFPMECEYADQLLEKLFRRIHEGCTEFISHKFANYVIQQIICSEFVRKERDYVIRQSILGRTLSLSQEKFGSFVIQKALKHAPTNLLHYLMNEILDGYDRDSYGRDALDVLLFDQYGNYVVQTMLELAFDPKKGNIAWRQKISMRIIVNKQRLKRYSSGVKIIGLVEKFINN
ncbi:unnamed protein product [Dracunculus medinensis]|uniref:PUM-HD domain-containing protein n=1 Tax=Dracunculus medinensis TaxID=318479 RepID=A0A0N4UKD1_DRAME|nr:unnamed protein product [Dracunculus medinensis]